MPHDSIAVGHGQTTAAFSAVWLNWFMTASIPGIGKADVFLGQLEIKMPVTAWHELEILSGINYRAGYCAYDLRQFHY